MVKYRRRLPVKRTNTMYVKLPILSRKLMIAAARSGAMGDSYALKICTMNGFIDSEPEKSARKNSNITIMNGL